MVLIKCLEVFVCANLGVNALDFRLMTWILEIKCPSTIVCSNNFQKT